MSAADLTFLFEIYRQTRMQELAATDWNNEQKNLFLQMQFDTQHRYYQQIYGNDDFLLILLRENPVGRLYIGHWPDEIRIIDISLLPQYQKKGIGTKILCRIIKQARQKEKLVSLHVEKNNPALRLYQRFGFELVADKGVYWQMQKRDCVPPT